MEGGESVGQLSRGGRPAEAVHRAGSGRKGWPEQRRSSLPQNLGAALVGRLLLEWGGWDRWGS